MLFFLILIFQDSSTHNSDEFLVSTIAVVVAFLALGHSIYESRQNRKFKKLSYRPILDIIYKVSPADPRFHISIANKGYGTAEIVAHDIYVDEESSNDIRKRLGINDWSDFSKYVGFESINWEYLHKGALLKPGDTTELCGFGYTKYNSDEARNFQKAMKRLKIEVVYTSVVKDCYWKVGFNGSGIGPVKSKSIRNN